MFYSMDSLNNNILNFKDFDRFFRRNGLLLYEEELVLIKKLIYRLHFFIE